MPFRLQPILLLSVIGLTFVWITTPILNQYSLQAFALSLLLYFVSKRLSNSKLWHLIPSHESWEMLLATFAFTLLVGATGNTQSPFFALTYIHLFFLVMSTSYGTSLLVGASLLLFHYALAPNQIAANWPILISIPIILIFFLFGKHQQEEVLRQKHVVQDTKQDEASLLAFISGFLLTKLAYIKNLNSIDQNGELSIIDQLSELEIETKKIVDDFRQQLPQQPTTE